MEKHIFLAFLLVVLSVLKGDPLIEKGSGFGSERLLSNNAEHVGMAFELQIIITHVHDPTNEILAKRVMIRGMKPELTTHIERGIILNEKYVYFEVIVTAIDKIR